MSLRLLLSRHFTAKDVPGVPVPNQWRHLHFPDAELQAHMMRDKLAKENLNIVFTGHSVAIRAKYSLLLATIGIVNNGIHPVEIPGLFTGDDDDGKTIMAACSKQGLIPSKWDEPSQEALRRFGKGGADSINKALADAGITEGDVLIFSHGPFANAQAAYLAGGDAETVAKLFAVDTKEGDRFLIEGAFVSHLPLIGQDRIVSQPADALT